TLEHPLVHMAGTIMLPSVRVGLARVFSLICVLAACSPPRIAEAPLPPNDPTRISHPVHAKVACIACHTMGKRPGSEDHKPCDDCHHQAFLTTPGELCKVCHTKVTTSPLDAPRKNYPPEDLWQAQPSKFSHRAHLDAGRVEAAVGFHVTCADCHVRDGKLAPPNHATCARCHADEASPPRLGQRQNCTGCHATGTQLRVRARLIRGDLHFDHGIHRTDRRGTAIKCEQCHKESATAIDYRTHAAPQIESCVGCHDDTDRAPEAVKMRQCGACHTGRAQTLTTI